ncbi:cell division protein FtsQ/DivIB [Elusimicrobiota bacterium]
MIISKYFWNFLTTYDKLFVDVSKIIIEGNALMLRDNIIRELGISAETSMVLLKKKYLEDKLLEDPRIKWVEIKKNYPDILRISIDEINPIGYYVLNSTRMVVTSDGDLFAGDDSPEIEIKFADKEKIIHAGKILNMIKESEREYWGDITGLDINIIRNILIFKEEYFVKWPSIPEHDYRIVEKYIWLEKEGIKKHNKKKEISYIDLRSASH